MHSAEQRWDGLTSPGHFTFTFDESRALDPILGVLLMYSKCRPFTGVARRISLIAVLGVEHCTLTGLGVRYRPARKAKWKSRLGD